MPRRLPPLNALRAFEAAARHLSFLKAAEELHVTPGAISQQVKSLEAHLRLSLFRRLPRGLLLTDAGQVYGRRLGQLFDEMAVATQSLSQQDEGAALTVTAVPSFSARWLIPRLGAFSARHPEYTVRILADAAVLDFDEHRIDCAIRFGGGHYPGFMVERLMGDEVYPVCSPRLLEAGSPLRTPADLARHVLLHDQPTTGRHELSWQDWLDRHGLRDIPGRAGPQFSYTHMSLQAAAAGLGVALGSTVLCGDDIASGQLVRPLAESVPAPGDYYLVYRPGGLDRPKLAAFRNWVGEECAAFDLPEVRSFQAESLET